MPIRENISDQKVEMVMNSAIGADGASNSNIVDTQGFDFGVTIAAALQAFTDGVFAVTAFESDAADMAGAVLIGADKLLETLPTLDTAATALGADWALFGFTGTKRYIRMTVTASVVTTGATVIMTAVMRANNAPVSRTK